MFKLRRKQVMIADWLDDYIKLVSENYDLSYSEVLRLAACYFYAQTLSLVDPKKYKLSISPDKIANHLKKFHSPEADLEETRKLVADIYFETKKILQIRTKELKDKK